MIFALKDALMRRSEAGETPPFALPPGERVYAVGDIHGCHRLLKELRALIDEDARRDPAPHMVEIYLGDYIDRGPDSAAVIQTLCQLSDPAALGLIGERVFLRGNHEAYVTDFLRSAAIYDEWVMNGGLVTLQSYGLTADELAGDRDAVREAFRRWLPRTHRTFYASRPSYHCRGGLVFVHAGVRPGIPLASQATEDLLLIRKDFLKSRAPLPYRVVHGHTPVRAPQVTPYRIGIDTGAFATGRLTCAVLEGEHVRFLSTG